MASVGGSTTSQAARITDSTRNMFRAILAENGVADTDDAILEQEVVMFFKLTRSHRIKLGRPGDFAECPVIIDDDDEISDTVTKTAAPSLPQSPPSPSPTSPHSSLSSPLSSPPSSPPSSPLLPLTTPSRTSLRETSDNVVSYAGMDGPNKRKRKRTSRPRDRWDRVGHLYRSVLPIHSQASAKTSLCAHY